jgi:hypothetical protein
MPGTFHSLHGRNDRFHLDSTLVAAVAAILTILIVLLLFFGLMVIRAS